MVWEKIVWICLFIFPVLPFGISVGAERNSMARTKASETRSHFETFPLGKGACAPALWTRQIHYFPLVSAWNKYCVNRFQHLVYIWLKILVAQNSLQCLFNWVNHLWNLFATLQWCCLILELCSGVFCMLAQNYPISIKISRQYCVGRLGHSSSSTTNLLAQFSILVKPVLLMATYVHTRQRKNCTSTFFYFKKKILA